MDIILCCGQEETQLEFTACTRKEYLVSNLSQPWDVKHYHQKKKCFNVQNLCYNELDLMD